MRLIVTKKMTYELYQSLEKASAMYDLLHAHARGETDLTEDQLANVVTGVSMMARTAMRRARGGHDAGRPSRPLMAGAYSSGWPGPRVLDRRLDS